MNWFRSLRSRLPVMFLMPLSLLAVMGSTNYKIQSDSINFGGGNSTSTSYTQESTFGEVATGDSSSAHYNLHAGYQQMLLSYISLSTSGNVTMPNVSGLTGGSSTAAPTFTVITDNAAGYSLSVTASTSPALKGSGGASFQDYTPAGSNPDYSFTITPTQSLFGFSPEGTDITSAYKDNGSVCGTGSGNTADKCWNGFSTSAKTIAQSSAANQPSGVTTTLKLRADVGTSKIQDAGSYTAIITVTAVTL